jgi:hypothetical protein
VRAGEEVLGSGSASWGPSWHDVQRSSRARPTRREGDITLDVFPLGARLPVGFPGSIFVRATDRATHALLGGVAIDAEPEPGLDIPAPHVTTCAAGWAEIVATPTFHVVGTSLHASRAGREGLWFGPIPVAGGASHVAAPLRIAPNQARAITVTSATTRGLLYAEVDDASGRAAAQVLTGPQDNLLVPPLPEGLLWIVTSSEPNGAEALAGAALARPILVEDASPSRRACEIGALVAESDAAGFPRWIALDGFAARRDDAAMRRRRGLLIGLTGLGVAALLEVLLVLQSARRPAAELSPSLLRRSPAGSVAIGLLAVLLGFALLAAFLAYRS